ncbi:penicillin-binding protein activator [Ancylobacter terrae]|uniref:penicillin-binding protein activator n=1 Tax=Ancylobacter sp. sgz301288 TaxID=3342077 RepID=UPI00385B99DE
MPLPPAPPTARHARMLSRRALLLGGGCAFLSACGGTAIDPGPVAALPPPVAPEMPAAPADAIGTGSVRIGLILPLGASGNAAIAAKSLRNAAEMALTDFAGADIQILVKDDKGTAQGAQAAAQAAIDEGARAIIGPLFAHAVAAAGQVSRARGVPLVGFSTDTNVATRGVFLLSFLPQNDVDRVVRYASARGRRGFAAMLPENAYGSVVEAAFQEAVPAAGGRVIAMERFATGGANIAEVARRFAGSAGQADALFIPDSPGQIAQQLSGAGVDVKRLQLLGTGLWDDSRIFADAALAGGLYAAPDPAGWRAFVERYRARFGADPVRTATLAHDAVSLMAAIVRTRGPMGINDNSLLSPSGFNGIDGVFRFRADGTNERGLAVMQVGPGGAQIVDPAPRSFGGAAL